MVRKSMLKYYQDKLFWNYRTNQKSVYHLPGFGVNIDGRYFLSLGVDLRSSWPSDKLLMAYKNYKKKIMIITGSTMIKGKVDSEKIKAVVKAHRREVLHCYKLNFNPVNQDNSKLNVKFQINSKGKVISCKISSQQNLAKTEKCVCKRLKTWKFPQTKSENPKVNYTWLISTHK